LDPGRHIVIHAAATLRPFATSLHSPARIYS
jgi:hypothetical protein